MILNHEAHWARLTDHAKTIQSTARDLVDSWTSEYPTTDQLEGCDSRIQDVLDEANHLAREILWLKGYQAGQEVKEEKEEKEEVNWRGDRILDLTPDTAPCSEVAESLQCSTSKITSLARKLNIVPVGEVTWELADGTVVKARSYNLDQWIILRNALVQQGDLWNHGAVNPPDRIAGKAR